MTQKKTGTRPIRAGVKRNWRLDVQTPVLFPEMSDNPWLTARAHRQERGHSKSGLTSLELCAGAGGQALGYEQAGIDHGGLVELDKHACATLRLNRPEWQVIEQDLNKSTGSTFKGVDTISGGLPCPPSRSQESMAPKMNATWWTRFVHEPW